MKPGDTLARGQRYGFIRFGSRVDVYLAAGRAAEGRRRRHRVRDRDGARGVPAALTRESPAPRRRVRRDRGLCYLCADMADFDTQRSLQKNRIRRRGIYLLPNLFTTAALFAGFYAIVQAMNLRFDQAAVAIFVAMVLDGLDGRVARLTRTQSAFGAEYDSLSDMVSFGAAPALIVYEWALKGMGKLGWIAAFVYVAGAALRLARFNTMLDVADKRWFTGMPSPAAAALVAGLVWIIDDYGIDPSDAQVVGLGRHAVRGPHDGQQRPYYSFKTINLKKSVPFLAIFVFVLVIALLSYQPAIVLFAGFVGYALSGYVASAWMWMRRSAAAGAPCRTAAVPSARADRSAPDPLRRLHFCGYSRIAMSSFHIDGRPALPAPTSLSGGLLLLLLRPARR